MRGIRRLYPFLGPMDPGGNPGWRDDGIIRHYEPERARAFFAEMHRLSPGLKIVPWTGGNLHQDVHLTDERQRAGFAAHMKAIVDLGADGVQLNVEPYVEVDGLVVTLAIWPPDWRGPAVMRQRSDDERPLLEPLMYVVNGLLGRA